MTDVAQFDVTLKDLSPTEKELSLVASAEVVKAKFDELFNEFARNAVVKGFRKGHIPRHIVLQRFRKDIQKDLMSELMREGYEQALGEHKLEPVAMPNFQRPEEYSGEGPFAFSFTVEVEPPVTEVKLDGLSVERERVVVSEEGIEHEIGHLREHNAAMRTVEGRDTVLGTDWVYVDFEGYVDGKPLEGGKQDRHLMDLKNPNLIDGFAAPMVGKKIDEPFEIEVTFPTDYHAEHLKGKPATFKCVVREISERVMPEVNDEWAKDQGHESLAALRDSVRADLEKAARERNERRFKDELWKAVVAANPLSLPPSLVQRQTQSILEDQVKRLRMYGIDPASVGLNPEEMFTKANEEAKTSLNAMYLQEFLAKEWGIEATDEDIEAKYAALAAEMNTPVEKFKAYYEQKHGEGLRYSIRLDKLTAIVKEKVQVVEVDPKPMPDGHDHE